MAAGDLHNRSHQQDTTVPRQVLSGLRGSLGTEHLYEGGKLCLEGGFRSTASMDIEEYIC